MFSQGAQLFHNYTWLLCKVTSEKRLSLECKSITIYCIKLMPRKDHFLKSKPSHPERSKMASQADPDLPSINLGSIFAFVE